MVQSFYRRLRMPPAPLTTPANQFANPGGFARTSAFRPSSLLPVDQAGNKQMSLLQKGMDMARGPQGQGLLGALGSPTATAALAGALSTTTNPNLRGLAGALKGIADRDAAQATIAARAGTGGRPAASIQEMMKLKEFEKALEDAKKNGDPELIKKAQADYDLFRSNISYSPRTQDLGGEFVQFDQQGNIIRRFGKDFQAEMLEKNKAQKEIDKPRAVRFVESSQQAYDIALRNLNKAFDIIARDIKLVGGVRQQVMKYIGGTPAKDLEAVLDVVRANIGFNKLQQMRSQSKTGGALGNVSNIELKLLQSVLGTLETTQKIRSLIPNLNDLYNNLVDLKNQIHRDYDSDGYERIKPLDLSPNKTPTEPSRYPAAINAYNEEIRKISLNEDDDLDEELAKKEKLWEAQPEERKEKFKTFINTETDPEKKQEKINKFIEKFGPNIFKQEFGS
tara:strand:- start:4752 stop:6101 length:1350 start_codon:yes stop_codon:yes gene_type:complete